MAGYNNLLIAAIDGDERFEVKVLLLMLHLKKKIFFRMVVRVSLLRVVVALLLMSDTWNAHSIRFSNYRKDHLIV